MIARRKARRQHKISLEGSTGVKGKEAKRKTEEEGTRKENKRGRKGETDKQKVVKDNRVIDEWGTSEGKSEGERNTG